MKTQKLGVLGVLDAENKLVAIVYHDESKRSQIIYNVSECGVDEIEGLLSQK